MQRWYALALALAVGAVLGASGVRGHFEPPPVHAAQTWNVQAGGDVEEELISTQAYFPNPLTVNVGDTVTWTFVGFHTVTFTGGQAAPPLIMPGPEAGSLLINPMAFFPSGPMDATYDGSGFLNSGVPEDEGAAEAGDPPPTFRVTFTQDGVFPYICLIHPGMEGSVTVVSAGAALPETPAEAAARGQMQFETLVNTMRNQIQMAEATQPEHAEVPGATTAHTAIAGLGHASGVSALRFIPDTMAVRRGDLITWTMPDPFEIHTVTFVSGAAPPEFVEPRFGPEGPGAGPPMLVIPAHVAGPTGGNTYRGTGLVNSGILIPGDSFALEIDAPAGSYEFMCLVHPFMRGTVIVSE